MFGGQDYGALCGDSLGHVDDAEAATEIVCRDSEGEKGCDSAVLSMCRTVIDVLVRARVESRSILAGSETCRALTMQSDLLFSLPLAVGRSSYQHNVGAA